MKVKVRLKAPPCSQCTKRPAKPAVAPFCSRRCAAQYGLERAGYWSYCPTCNHWAEWGHGDAWHEAHHGTIAEQDGKWIFTPGEGEEPEEPEA